MIIKTIFVFFEAGIILRKPNPCSKRNLYNEQTLLIFSTPGATLGTLI